MKNIIIAFVISLIISSYYLIIFLNTWAKSQPYSFAVEPAWLGNPGVYLIGFGALLVFIAVGIIFSLLKIRDMHPSLIFGFAMLISGLLNYIGFGLRSFQMRFFWPIYLSVFFGFGMYMLLKFIIKQWNIVYSIALFIIFTVLLLGIIKIPLVPYYSKVDSQGLMDPYHWSSLVWLSKNTEPDSRVYFFYGDIYSQDALLRNSKRVHYQADPENFAKALQERKIKRSYISELPGDNGGGIIRRIGIFNFEYATKDFPYEYFFGPQDICSFGYLVFDKVSQQQVLAQYNMLIESELMNKSYVSKVFENEVIIILKNSNLGAGCIEERSF